MAPNLVTLSGLGFIIVNVLLVLIYDPYLDTESPRWVYFAHAIGLFIYQTFDGCDGIHARRTGQSGPLGELFDHSIDSINATLCNYLFCSMLGLGYSYSAVYCQFALLFNFYLSTWEEYHTHILFLSEFSGPVEGILGICAAFILTGIVGPDAIWKRQVMEMSLSDGSSLDVNVAHVFVFLLSIGLLFNITIAKKNVEDYYSRKERIIMNGNASMKNAMKGLIPFFAYYSTVFLLVALVPEIISFSFLLSVGLTMAFVVGRIIVHHLTKQQFPMYNVPLMLPTCQLVLYVIAVNILHCDAHKTTDALAWFGLGTSFGIHACFGNEIIYEFTEFLDCYALTIKNPKDI
ncbi:bifunctional diacylglycerol cholinephosphotransferase/ethanolaminephosphotransferase KNAG_0H03580 [Huiozyma naganishii CBS 8797]|uniref:Uncharacterized protein n=1 Tax=Huiozyma naganishii (strain ATCC MYA-139 / BCRC 22969 / CBS 8797 / KCTC 17520 / NBRC 10181 / NCYC 3082 / Yp74L-3) TaxID=1071383 RepID=J7S213_HUIN7|nr:hypothetical protein KNAG_0H03580 [Kazachstania naganishii CBS 8797]CCK71772.1 hypothetical protein KNAG_0H03580 [Kazachstania naganishii CBS 8797]